MPKKIVKKLHWLRSGKKTWCNQLSGTTYGATAAETLEDVNCQVCLKVMEKHKQESKQ